jgi:thiosulfate/3-mercaptopyruvate sulfurtransferase
MLKAVGLQKVQVLNGGFQAAEKAGLPVNDKPVKPKVAEALNADRWQLPLADIREVEQYSGQTDRLIIDVREPKRYKGEFEPIDTIAGHIPGAINIPFASNLDESGCFLSKSALKEKYNSVFKQISPENTIVHCGSGVTACHTLFALNYAGFDIPKLYVGSWSEWSRNDKPIGKE